MISSPRLSVRVAAILLPLVLATGISVAYTNKVDRDSDQDNRMNDRRWCVLLVTLGDAYRAAPPATETGRRVADAIDTIRVKLGC